MSQAVILNLLVRRLQSRHKHSFTRAKCKAGFATKAVSSARLLDKHGVFATGNVDVGSGENLEFSPNPAGDGLSGLEDWSVDVSGPSHTDCLF